jgi:hypothetical protein
VTATEAQHAIDELAVLSKIVTQRAGVAASTATTLQTPSHAAVERLSRSDLKRAAAARKAKQ